MKLLCPRRSGFALAVLFSASAAHADPGQHFVVGSTTISPGVAAGVEYSTNPYHAVATVPGSDAVDLTVAPKLDLKLQRDDLQLTLGGDYTLKKYFGADVPLDQYNAFDARAGLDALTKSVVGLHLSEDAGLQNSPLDLATSAYPFTTETSSISDGALAVRPGYSLQILAGGEFGINDYATADLSSLHGWSHYNTRDSYGPTGNVEWRFLPRTAVVLDFSYLHSHYLTQSVAISALSTTPTTFPDANTMKIDGGLRGRVTNRLVVTLMAGYGSDVFVDTTGDAAASIDLGRSSTGGTPTVGEALQHLLFDGSLRYNLTPTTALTLGVAKNFRDSYFTNYVSFLKGYGSLDAKFGDHIGVLGEFDASAEQFRGDETRDDVVLSATGDLDYYIRQWVWLDLGGTWAQRASDQSHTNVQFDEFTGHLKVVLQY